MLVAIGSHQTEVCARGGAHRPGRTKPGAPHTIKGERCEACRCIFVLALAILFTGASSGETILYGVGIDRPLRWRPWCKRSLPRISCSLPPVSVRRGGCLSSIRPNRRLRRQVLLKDVSGVVARCSVRGAAQARWTKPTAWMPQTRGRLRGARGTRAALGVVARASLKSFFGGSTAASLVFQRMSQLGRWESSQRVHFHSSTGGSACIRIVRRAQ